MQISCKAKVMKSLFSYLSKNIKEGKISLNADGMSFMGLDTSQISMIKFLVPKNKFSEFVITGEKEDLGMDFQFFSNLVSNFSDDETVSLKSGVNDILIASKDTKFDYPLIEVEMEIPKEPAIEFGVSVEVDRGSLFNGITIAELISKYVKFMTLNGEMFLTGVSSKGKAKTQVNITKKTLIGDSQSMFPIEYIKDIIPTTAKITIEYGQNKPIHFKGEDSGVIVESWVAPKIED